MDQLIYGNFFCCLKRLKLKMSKYENYVKIWDEFDRKCDELDRLLNEVRDRRINCSLKVCFVFFLTNFLGIYINL